MLSKGSWPLWIAVILMATQSVASWAQPLPFGVTIYDSDVCALGGGSGNGSFEPGEAATLLVAVANSGDQTATGCVVTLTSPQEGPGGIAFGTRSTPLLGPVPPGPIPVLGANAVGFLVDVCFPCGTDILLDAEIVCNEGTWTNPSNSWPVPANCIMCGQCSGECEVGNLSTLTDLKGAKDGSSGARFEWSADPVASEYHLNSVAEKANLVPPNPKRPDVGIGLDECEATPPGTSCTDVDAFVVSDPLLHYQALAACGPMGDEEGPL